MLVLIEMKAGFGSSVSTDLANQESGNSVRLGGVESGIVCAHPLFRD